MMCDGLVFVRMCSSGACLRVLLRRWLNWAAAEQSGATGERRAGMGDSRRSLIHNWCAGVVSFKPNWPKRHLATLTGIPISPSTGWLYIKDRHWTWVLILALPCSFLLFLFIQRVCHWQALMSLSEVVSCKLTLGADDKQIYARFLFFFNPTCPCFPVSEHTTVSVSRVQVKAAMGHMWAALGLPHGIHRKDVHHNGPCVCETVSKQKRRSRELLRGTERCTTVIEIAFIPLLHRWNFSTCLCVIGLLWGIILSY